MSEHTPGPWTIDRVGAGRFRILAKQGPIQVSPAAVHGEADARLIAAAPDMLDALRKIADLIDSEADEPLNDAIRIAQRAIAKATEPH